MEEGPFGFLHITAHPLGKGLEPASPEPGTVLPVARASQGESCLLGSLFEIPPRRRDFRTQERNRGRKLRYQAACRRNTPACSFLVKIGGIRLVQESLNRCQIAKMEV